MLKLSLLPMPGPAGETYCLPVATSTAVIWVEKGAGVAAATRTAPEGTETSRSETTSTIR